MAADYKPSINKLILDKLQDTEYKSTMSLSALFRSVRNVCVRKEQDLLTEGSSAFIFIMEQAISP